jgi:hypothetical protein
MYILSHISSGKPSSPDHMKPVLLFSPGTDQHSFRTVGIALIIFERSIAMSFTHITQIQSFTYPYKKKCLILGEQGARILDHHVKSTCQEIFYQEISAHFYCNGGEGAQHRIRK